MRKHSPPRRRVRRRQPQIPYATIDKTRPRATCRASRGNPAAGNLLRALRHGYRALPPGRKRTPGDEHDEEREGFPSQPCSGQADKHRKRFGRLCTSPRRSYSVTQFPSERSRIKRVSGTRNAWSANPCGRLSSRHPTCPVQKSSWVLPLSPPCLLRVSSVPSVSPPCPPWLNPPGI